MRKISNSFVLIKKTIRLNAIKLRDFMAELFSRKEELFVKYDGNLNEIDADTFFYSIIPFTAAIQEIERNLNPDVKLKISIRAPERGSFVLQLLFEQSFLEGLFSDPSITTMETVIGIISGILNIRKFLHGDKPANVSQSGNQVIIVNGNGNTITVDSRTYLNASNGSVSEPIDKMFGALNKDNSISKFEVKKNMTEEPLLKVERSEFSEVAKNFPILDNMIAKQTVNETLIIFKMVFEEKYKWEFYRNEQKINAYIEDESFYKRINSHEEFGKGDRLDVEMEITKIYDDTLKTYIPRSYIIKKIRAHSKPGYPEQLNFI
jgi:hypothetical protein